MFELKYGITDGDIKAASRAVNLLYVIVYLCVAAAGLVVGIIGIVLHTSTFMFALGIVITVFGGILLVLAVLLTVAPQKAFDSIVGTSESEFAVSITHENITVVNGEKTTELSYTDMTSVRLRKNYIIAYFGKLDVLLIKSDGNAKEVYEYIEKRQGRKKPTEA